MEQRLERATKDNIKDVVGDQLGSRLKKALSLDIKCRFVDAYNLSEALPVSEMESIAKDVFTDQVIQDYSFSEPLFKGLWRVEIGMLPGVTDNVGHTASEAIKDRLRQEGGDLLFPTFG